MLLKHKIKNKTGITEKLNARYFMTTNVSPGFPLDLENLEKFEYTWKTWKYGILKNLINIMEKCHKTWKNLVATKNLPLTPLKQYKIHYITEIERKVRLTNLEYN